MAEPAERTQEISQALEAAETGKALPKPTLTLRVRRPTAGQSHPMESEKNLKAFGKNVKAFRKNVKAFRKNVKVFGKNVKAFRKNVKAFRENVKAFRENVKAFRENVKAFGKNVKVFGKNVKAFRENVKAFGKNVKVFEGLVRVLDESTLIEIEQAIEKLPSSELRQLHRWIAERDADDWDAEIARDAAVGKFDALRQRVTRWVGGV